MMRVRLPADLHDELLEAAKSAGRSVNAEILVRLQRSGASSTSQTTLAELVSHAGSLQNKLSFYEKNISLYAAGAGVLNYFAKYCVSIIEKLANHLPADDREHWDQLYTVTKGVMNVVDKFQVPDPANKGQAAASDADAKALMQTRNKLMHGTSLASFDSEASAYKPD